MRFGHLLDGLFTVSLLGARLDLERVELVGEGRGVGLAYGWRGVAAKVEGLDSGNASVAVDEARAL